MFSWKHADTDSDQEKVKMSERESKEGKMSKEEVDGKDEETTSSEESWTYAPGTENEKLETGVKRKTSAAIRLDFGEANVRKNSNASPKEMRYFSAKNIPKSNPIKIVANKEPISSINRKLVDRAEELFRCKPKSYRAKNAIMRMAALDGEEDKPLDSCDASGEYTEDSDERDSQSSEDNDGSVATCRRSESADGILDETPVGKTLMDYFVRGQRSTMRNRPWSMSNVSLLRNSRGPSLKTRSSMSESALNQVLGQFDKSRDFSLTLRSARMICTEDGTLGSYGSSRRRRTKIRKRMVRI